jgi:hypothetical protein
MNTKQSIYNILASAKPVKVELGAQEMYKTAADQNRILGDLVFGAQISGVESALRQNISTAYKWFKKLESDIQDFEVKAKELGLQPSSVENYKYAQKAYNDAQYEIAQAEKKLDALKKLL